VVLLGVKVLIRPGDVLAAARRVPGAARAVTGGVDAAATFLLRDRFTAGWDDTGSLPWLEERHIELVRGNGRLTGERTVEVSTGDGAIRRLSARRAVVLATGTCAALPPVPGLAAARPWDNRDVTSAKEVPRRLLVLGGGAIGLEMAQAFRMLGAEEVVVIEAAQRLLPREEPFGGEELRKALEEEGVAVRVGVGVTRVERDGDGPVAVPLEGGVELVGDELGWAGDPGAVHSSDGATTAAHWSLLPSRWALPERRVGRGRGRGRCGGSGRRQTKKMRTTTRDRRHDRRGLGG
jgi:pyruvate/2-oxoglutarate dehydrogenase complex dihydrolipoamide dehydrogenase (E3) component